MLNKKMNIFTSFSLVVFLCVSIAVPSVYGLNHASRAYDKPVKIAYIDYDNYISTNSDGELQGYAYEYMQGISKYTHRNYVFEKANWPDVPRGILNGDIDLYLVAMFTNERTTSFDFSEFPMIEQKMTLYVLSRSPYYYNDFENFNGKKIGILKDGSEGVYLAKYAKNNDFAYTLMEYESNSEMRYALENKQVDIIASNNFISGDNYKTVGIYGITPVYAIGKKGSPYIKEINDAMQKIKIDSPDFETTLYEKFYDKSVNFIGSGLTRVETNYIAGLDTVKVGVYDRFAPLSFVDNKGTFQGVYIDILNQLSSISGISFEPVALSPSTDPSLVLAAQECDIIMGISSEVKSLYPTINLSRYFLTSEAAVVGKINEEYGFDDDVTVALPRNFSGASTPVGKDYS
ncbi:MAG: transporter substrate-binding domain-containing protein, partial [Oscillospiraceae bacterium]